MSVFENNKSVVMESGQSSGVPGDMFLGEIKKKEINLEKSDGRNQLDEQLWREKAIIDGNSNQIEKSSSVVVEVAFFNLFYPPLSHLQGKQPSSLFPQFVFATVFLPFWSSITAVWNRSSVIL